MKGAARHHFVMSPPVTPEGDVFPRSLGRQEEASRPAVRLSNSIQGDWLADGVELL